jgi:alanine dehydrogenase
MPAFLVHQALHYCVTNMPGAVGCTSAYARRDYSAPMWAPFSATERFISNTKAKSTAERTANIQNTSK